MQASLLLRQQHAASVVAQNHRGRPLAAPQDRPSPGASAAMPSSSFGASAKAGIPKQITVTSDEMKPAATPTDVDDMLTLPFGEEDEDEDEFVLVTVGGGGKVNGAPSVSGHGTEQVIPRRYDSKLLRPRPSCLDGGDGVGSVRQLSFDGTPIPSRAPPIVAPSRRTAFEALRDMRHEESVVGGGGGDVSIMGVAYHPSTAVSNNGGVVHVGGLGVPSPAPSLASTAYSPVSTVHSPALTEHPMMHPAPGIGGAGPTRSSAFFPSTPAPASMMMRGASGSSPAATQQYYFTPIQSLDESPAGGQQGDGGGANFYTPPPGRAPSPYPFACRTSSVPVAGPIRVTTPLPRYPVTPLSHHHQHSMQQHHRMSAATAVVNNNNPGVAFGFAPPPAGAARYHHHHPLQQPPAQRQVPMCGLVRSANRTPLSMLARHGGGPATMTTTKRDSSSSPAAAVSVSSNDPNGAAKTPLRGGGGGGGNGECVHHDSSTGRPFFSTPPPPGSADASSRRSPSSSAVFIVSPSQSPTCSPLPQNLRNDPHRQAKIKTELCLYFSKGEDCPFGDRCNYAHGYEELRFKKLIDMERAGLIEDVDTYRTHPCLAWVSTGACPFGQRCSSVHDPRCAGADKCWLPHAEVQAVSCELSAHVDRFYHRNLANLHRANPLVDGFDVWESCRPSSFRSKKRSRRGGSSNGGANNKSREQLEWEDTYALVVCSDRSRHVPPPARASQCSSSASGSRRRSGASSAIVASAASSNKEIREDHRLAIAVLMSERGGHENYIYSPRSLVYNELCMIIATKYFRLVPTGRDGGGGPGSSKSRKSKNGSGKASGGSGGIPAGEKALFASIVEEVTEREYNSRRTPWEKSYPYTPRDVVVARIITFGPVGARGSNVSLWFDINPSDIVPCTPPMIKRYKRNKLRLQQAQQQQQGRQCSVSKSIVPGCFPPYPFMEGTAGSGGGGGSGGPVPSFKCPHHRPFFYVHTGDEGGGGGDRSSSSSAVALVRRIMMHRLRALRTRDRLQGRAFATEWNRLSSEETELKGDFERLRQRTEDGTWPVNVGREIPVDDETPVPRCGGRYRIDGRGKYGDSANFKIWESFTGTMVGKDMHHEGESNGSRLSVFQRLANGQAVDRSESTMLPHIGKPPPTRDGAEAPAAPHVPRKTRELWKELLLLDDDDDESDRSEGEWAKLLELHSENTEDLTSPAAAADPSLSDSPLGGGAAVAGTGASGEGGRLCSPSKPNRRRDHDMPLSSPMSGGVNNNAGGGNSPGGGGSSLNSHNKRAAINAAAASTRLVRLPSF